MCVCLVVGDGSATTYVLGRLHELGRNVAQQPPDDRNELLQERRCVVRLHILDLVAQRDRCRELAVDPYSVHAAAPFAVSACQRLDTDKSCP